MMPELNFVDKFIHLGHLLTENVYEFNMSKCIDDLNRQCNICLAILTLTGLEGHVCPCLVRDWKDIYVPLL